MADDRRDDEPRTARRRARPLIGRLGRDEILPSVPPPHPGPQWLPSGSRSPTPPPSGWTASSIAVTTEHELGPPMHPWGTAFQRQNEGERERESEIERGGGGYWAPPPVPQLGPPRPGPPSAWPIGAPSPPAPRGDRPTDARGTRSALLGALIGAVVGALVAGGLVVVLDSDDQPAPSSSRPALELAGEGMDIAGVLDVVQASVVSIEINDTGQQGLFGGAGSGVVISEDGLVLTNAHVVDGARSIDAVFFDGSRRDAELVGSLPADDIALIRVVDTAGLDPAELGSSADLQVGDEVVAIGNALNLGGRPSVTRGIVSAKDRTISDATISLDELIQTDAAINPGNSGGPLVNALGEVVGINTAIISDAQNVGFAIAIDAVKPRIDDIRQGRAEVTPDTALLGVGTNDLDQIAPPVLEEFGVDVDEGAFVVNVVPGSGADGAGLRPGDVIVGFAGEPVTSSNEVREQVRSRSPGDEVEIAIRRDGEEQTVIAELGSIAD